MRTQVTPVVVAFDGGSGMVVGTHDVERARAMFEADAATCDEIELREAAGEAISWDRCWLKHDDEADYVDWSPCEPSALGAVPTLVLE